MNSKDLYPIVSELRKIVDGLQYIIDQSKNNAATPIQAQPATGYLNRGFPPPTNTHSGSVGVSPYSVNDPRNPGYSDPRGKKSKYNVKNPDKYDRNKERNLERKAARTRPLMPQKLKEFVCYADGCDKNFTVWKDARAHFKEAHNIEKPKYKRSKVDTNKTPIQQMVDSNNTTEPIINNTHPGCASQESVASEGCVITSQTHCLPTPDQPMGDKGGVAADCC